MNSISTSSVLRCCCSLCSQIGNWLLQSRQKQSICLLPSLVFHTCISDLEKAFFSFSFNALKLVSLSIPPVDLTNTIAPPYKLYFYSYIFLPTTTLLLPYFKADFKITCSVPVSHRRLMLFLSHLETL